MADDRLNPEFRHTALLYRGPDGFVDRILPFLREGLSDGSALMVATSDQKVARLQEALGDQSEQVEFHDMAVVGRNPATILPLWLDFASRNRGRPLRGVGEPIWRGRTEDELVECVHHESLLNLAFDARTDLTLVCPYDAAALPQELLAEARRTHPLLDVGQGDVQCPDYVPSHLTRSPYEGDLPLPPAGARAFDYASEELPRLRRLVADRALAAGFPADRAMDLALAVHELGTNSVRHGGGSGRLVWWEDEGSLVCEVRDAGRLEEPLLGRVRPAEDAEGGRGLWIVNQLCDLVQIRSGEGANRVRIRVDPR